MNAHPRTSELIQRIIDLPDQGTITIDYLLRQLGDRAFALVILVFMLPNSIPLPGIPGFSTLTGLPVLIIAWQMLIGRESIWLPSFIVNRQLSQSGLNRILRKVLPKLQWLERYLMPRWHWACSKTAERVLGLLFLVLSVIIAFPIPGGNFLPGLSMSLIALGLLEKDGLFVCCAVLFALVSIQLMYEFIALAIKAAVKWVSSLF